MELKSFDGLPDWNLLETKYKKNRNDSLSSQSPTTFLLSTNVMITNLTYKCLVAVAISRYTSLRSFFSLYDFLLSVNLDNTYLFSY